MHCEQAKTQLRQNDGRRDQDYSDELFDHLSECRECWNFALTLWEGEADRIAAGAESPQPDVDMILDRAWQAHTRKQTRTFGGHVGQIAAAAVVLIVAGLVLLRPEAVVDQEQTPAPIAATPSVVRQVDFLLSSPRELAQATITLELDENLVLAGYPGMKRISWPATIRSGDNRLTLPLQLQSDTDGVITFNIESGGKQKQMMFTVRPSDREANQQVI